MRRTPGTRDVTATVRDDMAREDSGMRMPDARDKKPWWMLDAGCWKQAQPTGPAWAAGKRHHRLPASRKSSSGDFLPSNTCPLVI